MKIVISALTLLSLTPDLNLCQRLSDNMEDMSFRSESIMRYQPQQPTIRMQKYPQSKGLVAPMPRALGLPESLSALPPSSMSGFELLGGYRSKRFSSQRVCGDYLITMLFVICQGQSSPGLDSLIEEVRHFGDVTQKRSPFRNHLAEYVGNRGYGLAEMCCGQETGPCSHEFLRGFC